MTNRLSRRELLAGLAGLAVLAACGDDGDAAPSPTTDPRADEGPPDGAAAAEARADLPRDEPDRATVPPAAAALLAFAADLHRAAAAGAGDDAVTSPASVAFALAMTRAGAREETAEEMDRVLHAPDGGLDDGLNAIEQALGARSGERQAAHESTGEVRLTLANALWAQRGYRFREEFLAVLATAYGAGVGLVDYEADAEGARQAINAWVEDRTADLIPELLAPGTLEPDTRLVLTNAMALRAPWDRPFDPATTADGPFARLDGTTVTLPFMFQAEMLSYGEGDGWRAVELRYVGGELAMVVIVPDSGRFTAVEGALDGAALAAVVSALQPRREVRLSLPRWTTRTQLPLAEVLAGLGMPSAFDPDVADLSGMTAEERLFVSAVAHEAFITVDEEGTEAAAATAVVIRPSSAPADPPVELRVDRPFLYLIRDLPTGAPLFLGRVVNPER